MNVIFFIFSELKKCVPVENEIGTRNARQGYNNYAKTGRSFGLSGGTDSAIPNPVSIDSNNSTVCQIL